MRMIRSCLRRLRREWGAEPVTAVTSARIERWMRGMLEDGAARATVSKHAAYLRAALRRAHNQGFLDRMSAYKELKLNNARKGFFEPEEFRLIGTHLSEPVDDIARFAYAVGWRSEEILGLRWEYIDLARRVIRIGESKNGDGRVVPISGALLDVIERRQGKRWPGSP